MYITEKGMAACGNTTKNYDTNLTFSCTISHDADNIFIMLNKNI